MPANDDSWRFKQFKDTSGAYNRTLAVDTPESRAQFTAPTPKVNAASRIIPSPSGTNWNATFGKNGGLAASGPSSPSGTDWRATFGSRGQKPDDRGQFTNQTGGGFSFALSPGGDRAGLSLGTGAAPSVQTDATDFYKERVASMDLTKRDYDLYGAGSDYGFNY
jgi:hypothetical protein